jgi:hypothetical protein
MLTRARDVLTPLKDKKDRREQFEATGKPVRVATARSDRYVDQGIHEWIFEVKELSRSLLAFGVSTAELTKGEVLGGRGSLAWRSDGSLWYLGLHTTTLYVYNVFLQVRRCRGCCKLLQGCFPSAATISHQDASQSHI